jgi:hypothetical protein
MTEPARDLLATDQLVTALAERRRCEGGDSVAAALSALCAEIDREPIPAGALPAQPDALPFVRRVGIAAATVGVLAVASSGVAAAVTGDPLLPLRYVVGKLYEEAAPGSEPDEDRFLLGDVSVRPPVPQGADSPPPGSPLALPPWHSAVEQPGAVDSRGSADQSRRVADRSPEGRPGSALPDQLWGEAPAVDRPAEGAGDEPPISQAPDEPAGPDGGVVPPETAPPEDPTKPADDVVVTDPDDAGSDGDAPADQAPTTDPPTTDPPTTEPSEPAPTDPPPGDGRGRSGDHRSQQDDPTGGSRPGQSPPAQSPPGQPVQDRAAERRVPRDAQQPPADSTEVDGAPAAE